MESVLPKGQHAKKRTILGAYVLISFVISWAIEVPLALKAQGIASSQIPFSLHYLAAFGPCVAGILVSGRKNRASGLRELMWRMLKWRVGFVWWLVALSPLLLFLLVAFVMWLAHGAWLDFGMIGRVSFLPDLGIGSIFLWLATYGFGEETGWPGYLLPRLQRDRSALSATLILGSIGALWHTPSFFYLQTVSSPGILLGFLFGVLAGAIFLTWLYNK